MPAVYIEYIHCLPFALPDPLSTLLYPSPAFPLPLETDLMGHTYQGVSVPSGFLLGLAERGRVGHNGGDKGQVFYSFDFLPGRSPWPSCHRLTV